MDIYYKHLKNKYELSKKFYKKVLTNNDDNKYLYYYDIMNTYSLFPTIIEFNINSDNKNSDISNIISMNDSYNSIKNGETEKFAKIVQKKIKKYRRLLDKDDLKKEIQEEYKKKSITDNIQSIKRFFHYELVEELIKTYNGEHITIAWLKCYELLYTYKFFENVKDEKINCFCLCEQPGAFIYAINHYIKEELNKDFIFTIQSLNNKINNDAFPPDIYLYKEYSDNYDYGPDITGDVTDINNIIHYRKSYFNNKIDLITSDCGIDCSDDFSKQESNLLDIIIGQIIIAIGLSSKGSNFFFKLFTIYEELTKQFIFLLKLLYNKVIITRVLATKITSGEIYCVCKNFKYEKQDMTSLFDKLCDWYKLFKHNNNINLLKKDIINDTFYNQIYCINKTLLYRRLLNINSIYFKYSNHVLTINNQKIATYINSLLVHYIKYFITIYNIKPLNHKNKLVKHVFKSKWKNKRLEITGKLHNKYIYPLNMIFNNDTYMFYLIGSNTTLNYNHKHSKLTIQYEIINNSQLNNLLEKLLVIFRKSRLFILQCVKNNFLLYNKYYYILPLYHSIDYILTNHKQPIYDLIILNYIYKEKNNKYDFSNETYIDYIQNKFNINVKYHSINNYNFSQFYNGNYIYYVSFLASHNYQYEGTNIYNILLDTICNILCNINNGSSIIITLTSFDEYIFDIINFTSKYFINTTFKTYKYMYSISFYVIFSGKCKNIRQNILKKIHDNKNKSIYRLYNHTIDQKYIDFIDELLNDYLNKLSVYTNIILMYMNDSELIPLIKNNINIYREEYDHLFLNNKL